MFAFYGPEFVLCHLRMDTSPASWRALSEQPPFFCSLCALSPLFLFLSRRINLFQASSMGTLNNFHVSYKLLGHLAVIPSLSQQV